MALLRQRLGQEGPGGALMNALIQEAQAIVPDLLDAAAAAQGAALELRLRNAARIIAQLADAFPEDGIPEGVQRIIGDQRERLTDAACTLKCVRAALTEPDPDDAAEAACNAESATKLLIELLDDINDALDSTNIRKALEAQEEEVAS